MKYHLLLIIILLVTALSNSASAQGTTTSGMNGRVVDQNGEGLPGATVLAIHQPTGSQFGNITDFDGYFRIPNMNIGGPYKVSISFVGYKTYEKDGIYLILGQTYKVNTTLSEETTQLAEVVVTSTTGEIIDGNRTGAETNVGKELINTLPTAARNISDFTRLTPQAKISGDNEISIAGANERFNSFYIDGAYNTDAFGLEDSGTNGGDTGAPPISLDAIDQFSINIAPYDVTQGGFGGGGINAVTKSGTNEVSGSVYYFFRNENLAGKTPTDDADGEREKLSEFSAKTYGLRIGGPIIKDKLFFFVNGEFQRDETPNPSLFSTYQGNATVSELNGLSSFFSSLGYDPGSFEQDVKDELTSDRLLVKFDWNINKDHKLMVRHSINDTEITDRNASSRTAVNFSNNGESTTNEVNSTSLELKSNFGNNLSNSLILARTKVTEDRDPINDGRLPSVTIFDGENEIIIGPDPFSTGNLLEQRVFTITNNLNLYKGKHTFTFGTHNEFYTFTNLFLGENFGNYSYGSIDSLVNNLGPNGFSRSYSLANPGILGDDIESGAAVFNAYQIGLYAQDEYQFNDKLKLTGGLRIDIPNVSTDPVAPFDDFETVTKPLIEQFYDINGAQPGKSPDPQVLISPRIGFNYDLKGDQSTQIRGGAGLFTGRILFVWSGGAFTNSGGVIGRVSGRNLANGDPLPYITDLSQLPVAGDLEGSSPVSLPTGRLEMFEEDFKYPQVFRTSVAVDQKLPWWGLIGTFEGIYTANVHNIALRNVNISPTPIAQTNEPISRGVLQGTALDPRFQEIIVVGNTNKGHSYNITAQIQKPFDKGFTGSLSYTFGRSLVINDGTSSQLTSVWRRNEVTNNPLNDLRLTRSDFDPGSRILAVASYRKEYLKHFASSLSFVYTGQSGQPFSYVINQSGGASNIRREDVFQSSPHDGDLPYIPRDASEIVLVDILDDEDAVITTAEQQWAALDAFIEADDYLKDRRGEFAERNVPREPFTNIVDLKFMQEFFIDVNGKRNTLQFTFDIFNFTNLLNKDWGRIKNTRFNAFPLLNFAGYRDEAGGDYTPTYTFNTSNTDPDEIFNIDDSGINSSRWQMQIGLRYIFN